MTDHPILERRHFMCNPAAYTPYVTLWNFVRSVNPPEYEVQLGTNKLVPLICGAQYLPRLKAALEAAQKSIWITVWGFDPDLPLVMAEPDQRRPEDRLGAVLQRKAEQDGVDVRILVFVNIVVYIFKERTLMPGLMRGSPEEEDYRGDLFSLPWSIRAHSGDFKNLQLLTRSGPAPGRSPEYEKTQQELNTLRQDPAFHEALNRVMVPRTGATKKDQELVDRARELEDRLYMVGESNYKRRQQGLPETNPWALEYLSSHHQKTVLIDHATENANGFIQGFNLLRPYFDDPEHPYHNPRRLALDPEELPRQDIGAHLTGHCLLDVFRNFKENWNDTVRAQATASEKPPASAGKEPPASAGKEPSVSAIEEPPPLARLPRCEREREPTWPAQVLRTWPKTQDYSIKNFYYQSISCTNEFIYVEDQYFRMPEFAQEIVKWAQHLKNKGTSKALHVFVVTNLNTIKENKSEQAARAATLEALKRGDLNVEDEEWERRYSDPAEAARVTDEVAKEMDQVGVRVSIGVLRTSHTEQTHTAYKNIYVHSKLTIFDDVCYIVGSANWNLRSMVNDTELSIAIQDIDTARSLREELWGYHLNGIDPDNWEKKKRDGKRTGPADWYEQWEEVMLKNDTKYRKGEPRIANLFAYHEKLDERSNWG